MTEAEIILKRDAIQARYEAFRVECLQQVTDLRAEANALENAVRRRLAKDQGVVTALNDQIAKLGKTAAADAAADTPEPEATPAPQGNGNGNGDKKNRRKM